MGHAGFAEMTQFERNVVNALDIDVQITIDESPVENAAQNVGILTVVKIPEHFGR